MRLTEAPTMDDLKLKEKLRIEREEHNAARQKEYRDSHRMLNRKERRKLAAEISKVERGDYG